MSSIKNDPTYRDRSTESIASSTTVDTNHFVHITRVFNAPRELVFRAWTNPEQLVRWYAPNGCTIWFKQLDIRPGGVFHSCISTPQAHDCWCKGMYLEINEPEKLVFTMAIADKMGRLIGPVEAGMDPDWPGETTVTVTFEEYGKKPCLPFIKR